MPDDLRENSAEVGKQTEVSIGLSKSIEDLKREIDTLRKQQEVVHQERGKLLGTANTGGTLSNNEQSRLSDSFRNLTQQYVNLGNRIEILSRTLENTLRQQSQQQAGTPSLPKVDPRQTALKTEQQPLTPTPTKQPTSIIPQPNKPTPTTTTPTPTPTPNTSSEDTSTLPTPTRNPNRPPVAKRVPTWLAELHRSGGSAQTKEGSFPVTENNLPWMVDELRTPAPKTQLRSPRSTQMEVPLTPQPKGTPTTLNTGITTLDTSSTRPNDTSTSNTVDRMGAFQRALAEYKSRLATHAETLRAGHHQDTIAGGVTHKAVLEQAHYLRGTYEGLDTQERKQAQNDLLQLERQRAVLEREEIARIRRMNGELTRSQYALAEFATNLAGGRPSAALGAAAGGLGGPIGAIASVIMAGIGSLTEQNREYNAGVRRGGATLSPSAESTEQQSETLLQLKRAQRSGEIRRKETEAHKDQLFAQAVNMRGWGTASQGMGEIGARIAAYSSYIAQRVQGVPEGKASASYNEQLIQYVSRWIKEHGGTPNELKRNFIIPGVQANIGSALEYQTQLQLNQLQRNDLDNEILKEQLQALHEIGALLTGIRGNTNGLENLHPTWST